MDKDDRYIIKDNLALMRCNIVKAYELGQIPDIPMEPCGKVKRKIKSFVKKCVFWIIRPYIEKQREFNHLITNAVEDSHRILSLLLEEQQRLEETIKEISKDYIDVDLFINPKRKNRVIQIVSTLNYGDAVGNDVMAIDRALMEGGHITGIFAQNIHKKILPGRAYLLERLPKLNKDDVVIYHFASQDDFSEQIKKLQCKVVLRYHNVTPPEFFHDYDMNAERATRIGLEQVAGLKDFVDYGMIVSEFNKNNLLDMGYKCPMAVVPILIPFKDYHKRPNQEVITKYNDTVTNILFVGRMAPNKAVEDVIAAFAYYKEHYNYNSRLFLVGNYSEEDRYYQYLNEYIEKIGVKNVIFPGHILFDEILAYYKLADVFLCMSEHEGFCVPLIEAMIFKVPIIAYASSAVPDTLGDGGIILEDKEPALVADKINQALNNEELKKAIRQGQEDRLRLLSYDAIKTQIFEFVDNIMKN